MSLAPAGADYQSVLECPCTSRSLKLMQVRPPPRAAPRAVGSMRTRLVPWFDALV
jgi:hypothetical protein